MPKKTFSKEAIIQEAFNIFKRNAGFLILLFIIYLVLNSIPVLWASIPLQMVNSKDKAEIAKAIQKFMKFLIFYSPIIFIWYFVLIPGIYKLPLSLVRGIPVKLSQIFTNFSSMIRLLIASFLVGIILIIGFIFFIAPGVYLAIRFQLFAFLIVDKNLSVIEALKESWKLTERKVGNLFVLGLILIGISIGYNLLASIIPVALGIISGISSAAQNLQMASILIFAGSLLSLILKTPLYAFIYLVQALIYEKISQSENQEIELVILESKN